MSAMSYYDKPDEYSARGIDYDLDACLEYNPQGFGIDDIERVFGVVEGENDGPSWHWILSMKDGRFIYLTGGCDYTGWDCQSGASHHVAASAEAAAQLAEGSYSGPDSATLRADLSRQIAEGKALTWRDSKDREFGIVNP